VIVFGGLLVAIAIAYYQTHLSRTLLFLAAFILTRSLGAVVGDFLDKPLSKGGLNLNRFTASFVLLALIVILWQWTVWLRHFNPLGKEFKPLVNVLSILATAISYR
jgi:uncharacterized membrane-anchored protein